MEQLINVRAQVNRLLQKAQTENLTPEQVREHLVQLETNIKSIFFPRVPNKEDAMNRKQLINDIVWGYVRLEYMYNLMMGSAPIDPDEVNAHNMKRAKQVEKWIG